jgi:hypothetical protein
MNSKDIAQDSKEKKGFSGLQVLGIILVVMLLTAGITGFVVWRYVFPPDFKAVQLSESEQQVLDDKLSQLGIEIDSGPSGNSDFKADGTLAPERYTEANASREVHFSEDELNALLANNTNLAHKLAIDLSDDLASAKMLVPMDPDFPVLGGKTLRINAGVELAFRNGQPVVKLIGISIMGVPVPNAWLGNLKNVDLMSQFGGDPGIWQALAAGVKTVEVHESQLTIRFAE